jgi:hypothetical protein
MNNQLCPFCRSILKSGTAEGTLNGNDPVTWECGTIIKGDVVLPSDECKERINKRIEIKNTDVSQYVSMMEAIDPLLPEKIKIEKKLDVAFECKDEFKPKVLNLMKKLGM